MVAAALSPSGSAPGGSSRSGTNFPLRKTTGTAGFHLSKDAVDLGFDDLNKLTERQAILMLADARWGSTTYMPCPHCGTLDTHYWFGKERRWKCKCCDKRFSVTSGSVFADHKLSLTKIIKIVFTWVNGSSGKPALQLRRDWNVAYGTAFTLAHKLREGLMRGFNVGVLAGVVEMDGADMNGRRYREKRNKPQGGGNAPKPTIPAHLLKPEVDPETGEILVMGPPKPHKHDKKHRMPPDRRILHVIRLRGLNKGKGASNTRVAVALAESTYTVTAVATRFASAESAVMSDEDPSYAKFSLLFAEHKTINHSKAYSAPGGVSNNQAESFNWRMRRLLEGIYLSPSNKYLIDYAVEAAWREDVRRLSTGKKLRHVLGVALRVGLSLWWRGYHQGKHRLEELLVEGPKPAKGRGKKKGWQERPPR
ncbi:transposase [Hydrogenophaga crocea]|uniref:IS1595 family transposase n=1 Tax=Hydrogenophaga crocea TaxID=2716225 RepID=A0A6G8II73_9BURK|nr:transposase [Hydrogenophaga crocea]QIM52831.1 IS1595 family transposase [Hydrogenophaga crocea]